MQRRAQAAGARWGRGWRARGCRHSGGGLNQRVGYPHMTRTVRSPDLPGRRKGTASGDRCACAGARSLRVDGLESDMPHSVYLHSAGPVSVSLWS